MRFTSMVLLLGMPLAANAECEDQLPVAFTLKGAPAAPGCLSSFKGNSIKLTDSDGKQLKVDKAELEALDVRFDTDGEEIRVPILAASKERKPARAADEQLAGMVRARVLQIEADLHRELARQLLAQPVEQRTNLLAGTLLKGQVSDLQPALGGVWRHAWEPTRPRKGIGETKVETRSRTEIDVVHRKLYQVTERREHTPTGHDDWKASRKPLDLEVSLASKLSSAGPMLVSFAAGAAPQATSLPDSIQKGRSESYAAVHPNGEEMSGFVLRTALDPTASSVTIQRANFSEHGLGSAKPVQKVDIQAAASALAALAQGTAEANAWPTPELTPHPTPPPPKLRTAAELNEEERIEFEKQNANTFRVQVTDLHFSGLKEGGACIDPFCDEKSSKQALSALSSALKTFAGPKGVATGAALETLAPLLLSGASHMSAPDYAPQIQAPNGVRVYDYPLPNDENSLSYTIPSGSWTSRFVEFGQGDVITISGRDIDELDASDPMGTLVISQDQLREIASQGGVGFVFNRGIQEGHTPPILAAKVVVSQPVFEPRW